MRISFVIPAYNEEGRIGECLDAIEKEIAAAHYGKDDYELIVADNNSTDGTDAVVARHHGAILIHESRRGANRARQTGFEASHGNLVAFLDADTEVLPGWLTRVEKEFAADKGLVCISGPFIYYDLSLTMRVLSNIFYFLSYLVYLADRIVFRTSVIQGGTEVVRREALQKIGGHNVDLTFYGDDADLALRLSRVGKVKFSFRFSVRSSGRRLAKEGAFTMGLRYAFNYFWILFFHKPFTKSSIEVRLNDGQVAYDPISKTKEVLSAGVFAVFFIILFGAIIGAAYLIVVHW